MLEHMRTLSWWFLDDEPLRLAPDDLWRNAEQLRVGSGEAIVEQMRRMTLPREALLLRRMEGMLFQIASTVRAEGRWGALLDELIGGGAAARRARPRARRVARRARALTARAARAFILPRP